MKETKKLPEAMNLLSFTRNKLEVNSRVWKREDTV